MQTVLLDTCALIMTAIDEERLGDRAHGLLFGGKSDVLLSPATYWEIAIKVKIGKLILNVEYDEFMQASIDLFDLTILDVTTAHTSLLTNLELYHRDPFDRLLIAQAISEGLPIVSSDAAFDHYPVTRVWKTETIELAEEAY